MINVPVHFFWVTERVSLCGEQTRPEIADLATPTSMAFVVHHSSVCPRCLLLAEIGTTDVNGNRIVPSICGVGVSERAVMGIA